MRPSQKFTLIEKLQGNTRLLCKIARVSRAGYYKWQKGQGKGPRDYDDYLLIKEIFDKGRSKWGWRTIQMKLKAEYGITMNHKKIERIKNEYGLVTKVRRRNPYKDIFKKTKEHRYFPNILDRKFSQAIPGATLCTDITYLPYGRQMAYLSAVKDIASREIVGWSVAPSLQMELVFSTLDSIEGSRNKKIFREKIEPFMLNMTGAPMSFDSMTRFYHDQSDFLHDSLFLQKLLKEETKDKTHMFLVLSILFLTVNQMCSIVSKEYKLDNDKRIEELRARMDKNGKELFGLVDLVRNSRS